jgi:hypothetical protein
VRRGGTMVSVARADDNVGLGQQIMTAPADRSAGARATIAAGWTRSIPRPTPYRPSQDELDRLRDCPMQTLAERSFSGTLPMRSTRDHEPWRRVEEGP